jgi:putative MATE family efflux protein|tara:strand:+ start:1574 stop:3007 length:1434 start_codon:yes stop_codon:yes gene_type:complete
MKYRLKHIIVPVDRGLSKNVLTLALPVIAGNISRVLMNMMDVAMVGRLGAEALAAVGMGGVLIWSVMSFSVAIRTGVQTVTARRYGEKKFDQCGKVLNSGILFALLAGGLFTIAGYTAAPVLIKFLIKDPVVIPMAIEYTRWSFLGAVFITLGYAYQGFYNGVERTKVHMQVSVVSNILNVYLNAGFIFGSGRLKTMLTESALGDLSLFYNLWEPFYFPAWGVKGAAIATLIASGWMVVHYSLYGLFREFRGKYHAFQRGTPKNIINKVIKIALPQGLQEMGVTAVFILYFKIVAMIGTVEVAATEVAFAIMQSSFLPAIGFGLACATLVGKYLGEKNPDRAEVCIIESVRWSVIFMGSMGILFLFLPRYILPLFTNEPEVIKQGIVALRILGVVQFIDAFGLTLWFALSGAGNTKYPAVVEMIIAWGFFLPASFIMVTRFDSGLTGPWLCFALYILIYAAAMVWKILKGDWKKIKV